MHLHDVLFLLLNFNIVICSFALKPPHHIYPEAKCQVLGAKTECLTLSVIVKERDKYFTSNSTFVFHDGDHILQGEVVSVSNISNFIAQGYNSPKIICMDSSFSFSNVSVRITSINLKHCRITLTHSTALIQDSSFSNGEAVDGGALSIHNSSVRFERANRFSKNTAERYGGAIFANSSTLTFSERAVFASNKAKNGGAVYCGRETSLSFEGESIFVNSTGSAVFANESNTVSFSGNSSFISNSADYGGGAVYGENNNILSFRGNSRFTSNSAGHGGGAIYGENNNTLIFHGNSRFKRNSAGYAAGAVGGTTANVLSFIGNSSFTDNRAGFAGGAVSTADGNTLNFTRNSKFTNNTAGFVGGAVGTDDGNTLSFTGNSIFTNNSAGFFGSAVGIRHNNTITFIGNNQFMNNMGVVAGAVAVGDNNICSFRKNSTFTKNTARYGGAIYVGRWSTLTYDGNNTFISNTADEYGGAVDIYYGNTLRFNGNSIFLNNTSGYGGAINTQVHCNLSFYGSSTLKGNKAVRGGGIALFVNSHLYLSGSVSLSFNIATYGGGVFAQDSNIKSVDNIEVTGNKAVYGGGIFVQASKLTLQGGGLFLENVVTNAERGYGGAIFARSSALQFEQSITISNNTAGFGGGLAFFGVYDGKLVISDETNVFFQWNVAHRRGGAIYVEDDPFTYCTFDHTQVDETCFIQLLREPVHCFPLENRLEFSDTHMRFDNNVANESGDIMYGGHLESCVVCGDVRHSYYGLGSEVVQKLAEPDADVFSKLSSDPYKVCICENNHPNCDQNEVNITVYPGQVLVIPAVAVGQMNGTVPSVIRAVTKNLIQTSNFQTTQPAENSKECSQLQYPLFSRLPQASLELYSDEPCSISGHPLTFQINFLPCPVGFTLSEQGACICDKRLRKYTESCNIEDLTINRNKGATFWVGVEGSNKLILHPHCPFDYCNVKSTDVPLNSTTNYSGTDILCANGRSGILCGACQSRHSLALGSSRCLSDCSDSFLSLILAFALAGLVLVVFLFTCRLTVADGTLNGLIFYANVLAVNQTVFFPSGERNLLTVFIAWLNLDLGIETCFFVGLDAYYRTFLQFAFPIYIWIVVGVIILLAHKSVLIANFIKRSKPIAVLTTLFLLSYTKLLRAIVVAFSFTTLEYSGGSSKYVWLYDGNIRYLDKHDGRHMFLFAVSLFFLVFIFLPYTLLLLCGQWIQRKVEWLSTTKQLYLTTFLDTHYGPYKDKHRYWTGLLLLLRFMMLFIATIINISRPQDPFSNLVVILVVVSSLIVWGWIVGGFYKKWHLEVLDASFALNLAVLSGGTYQIRLSGGNQAVLIYTSVGAAFVTFIGIVISAVVQRVNSNLPNYLCRAICHRFMRNSQNQTDEESEVPTTEPTLSVTYSVVEILEDHSVCHKEAHDTESSVEEANL